MSSSKPAHPAPCPVMTTSTGPPIDAPCGPVSSTTNDSSLIEPIGHHWML
jgi:hypothetical protein